MLHLFGAGHSQLLALDNRCPAGDAAAALASGDRVGPLTTVVGVAALAARVAELLLEQGHNPPVLASQNLDGRRVAERNHQLLQPYRGSTRRPR